MNSSLTQIALVVVGLAIFTALYVGYPGKGLKSAVIIIALLIGAALLLHVVA
jgi:hypothetical protein